MKPVRKVDSTSQSCSCTSCPYKSESEQLSIRRYIARGSRISRLYFGKYIPLRERKLLNRLVRTRAVYDDLRARLISDSTLSLDKKADLRPGRQHHVIKPIDSQKSGAILEIVDIIDKGASLDPKKISDCCSCCSCSSKSKIKERKKKGHRRKKAEEQAYEEEFNEIEQIGTGEGVYAKTYEKKYGKAGQIGPGEEMYVRTYEKKYGKSGQAGTGEGMYAKTHEKKFGKTGQTGTSEGMLRAHDKKFGKTGQTGTGERFYETFESEFGKTAPGTKGERYNKRGVRFKAKRIRSEPCTCTFKFSGLIKKHSKAMFKKNQPFPLQEPFLDLEELNIVETTKKQNLARKSLQKYNELRNKLDQSMKKMNESKANMKKNLQLRAKKSLEQVKQAKNKIKSNIESGVRKSIQAVKDLRPKEHVFETVEYPEEETKFKIKKDSIVKFKDYLKRKEMMKDWECDFECKPDVCVPEQCFKIIKLRRKRKPNRQRDRKYGARYEMIQREVRIGGAPLSKSSSAVQAKQLAITTATHTKKHKPMLNVEGKKQVMAKRVVMESKELKKEGMEKGVTKIAAGGKKIGAQAPHVISIKHGESFHSSHSQNIKKKRHIRRENEILKEREHILKKPHARGRQAVRIESSFSFGLEFYKKPRQTTSHSSELSDIRMHAPSHKRKKLRRRHESNVTSKSSLESSQGTPDNFKTSIVQTDKYERPPITLQQRRVRSKDSQCECKIRLSNIRTNTDYVTKSVSSATRNVATFDKNTSKEVKQGGRLSQVSILPSARPKALTLEINESYSHNKQAVRIGSTFSFSVEFYKKGAQNEITPLKAPVFMEKQEVTHSKNRQVGTKLVKTRSKNRQAGRRLMQVKGTSAKAYNEAKDTLRRCFCTLKFNVKAKTKKKTKITKKKQNSDKKSETEPQPPYMIDKYVETKKYRYLPPKLLPYECEPGICIPDECDPILCKKIIDMRKRRNRRIINKSTGSYTGSRKTKSTSSIISRSFASARAKTVQSSIVPTKVGYTNAPKRYKNRKQDFGRDGFIKTNISASERQAVRIGSSFSFNIEFYKNKPTPSAVIANEPSLTSIGPEINYNQLKYKRKGHKNRNKSIFTQVINVDKYVGPSLKRCLCTLKLYKNKVPKRKQLKKVANMPANTQTFEEVPVGEFVDKGTRTKREHHYKLLPYECEPYFCVPGECDPYLCLQRIKKRNTRNTSAFTDEPEMRSISSLTENSLTKSEAVLVQPKLFPKGTNMKTDYVKVIHNRQKPARAFKASNSKQAVRIGSSFNFNIEFSKKIPGEVMVAKYPKLKQSSIDRSKMNRGITVTKVRVGHTDTQALEPRKAHKASFVRPMLKRCFCTLNLQKKTKKQYHKNKMETKYFGPEYYTVARATTAKAQIISHSFDNLEVIEPKHKIISISTSSFLLHKFTKSYKSKNETLKLWSSLKAPFKEAVFINSNLSMKLDIIRQLGPSKESIARYMKQSLQTFGHALIEEKTHECLKVFNETSNDNVKKVTTGFSHYLEQCFCTMNVQISNPGRIKNKDYKLKPYECEPGVCVPGECNPYECQKLIMKRFGRNVHKSSATDLRSVSSNATATARLDSRNNQIQTRVRNQSRVTIPQKYKPQRLVEPTQRQAVQLGGSKQRQAVRIKSSFSFDLEFYKHRPQSIERYIKNDQPSAYIKNPVHQMPYGTPEKGTQAVKMKNNRHTGRQSAVGFVHKGTAPMKKRCFCTLKLQKKGRIPKEYRKMNYIQEKEPSITSRDIKIGTNAKKQKIPIGPYDLKSYECEPGICIPGQCDPYKCLELMKHRKHLGINTNQKDTVSLGSMTSEEKYKARAVGALPLRKHHKATKTIRYSTSNQKDNLQIVDRSSRQAVRIGSNFSFNIEFYKDTPQLQTYTDTNLQKRIMPRSDSTGIQEIKVRRDEAGDKKDVIISPKKKNVSHRAMITEKPLNQEAAITTSLLKRCFCTKNLHSVKFLDQQKKKSFKNKCFCLLGLDRKGKEKRQATEQLQTQAEPVKKLVQTAEKPTNTNAKTKIHLRNLEPYECEPGICIPGQCDPYLCDKIIQQRLAKQISKKSETDTVHSQSVSSSFGNYKRSKNQRIQAQGQTYENKITYKPKNLTPSGKVISNSDKRLVRIGSNFSFNIEFYKENINGSAIKEQVKEVKTYPVKDIQYGKVGTGRLGMDSKSIGTETAKLRHNKAQIKMGPLLKRCFCTLKLMNKPQKKIDGVTKGKQFDTKPAIQMRSVETQSHKLKRLQNDIAKEVLLPYECEPNVCIPGKCDPVECLQRIKKRKHRTKEFGTITKYPKTKSIGSVGTKTRNENLQAQHPYTLPNKGIQKTNVDISGPIKAYNQPRQAVRIGSNFSFNIEFFKDVDNGLPKMITESPPEELITRNYVEKRPQYHTSTQPPHLMRNVDSQVISPKLQSTETAMAHLKRCFCTLPLRNKKLAEQKNTSIKIQSDQPKSDHSSLGNFLKKCACTLKFHKVGKQNQPPPAAVKYEIKGTSTHTPRAPGYRVQKPVRILEAYECEPFTCVPGECNPYECLKRIQRRQVRDFGTGYKRNLKDSATDSIKQPVTKSTKVQYHHKQKLNSKGTSLAWKRIRNNRDIAPISYEPSFNPNRQAVRIGSNFSFNIEFFKDNGTRNTQYKDIKDSGAENLINLNKKRKPRTKSISTGRRRVCNRISQCSSAKRRVTLSATDIAPQRCFCTLKLLKKPNHPHSEGKLVSPALKTKDKMTATKIKYTTPQDLGVYECPPLMCIPGECNPYECLEKIKKREAIKKSRNVGTRAPKTTVVSVGNRPLNLRARKIQSQIAKKRNIIASTPYSEPQSEILKSPHIIEHSNRRHKRAVRIGSNFNFNVEFFKQKVQPAVVTVPKIVTARDNGEDLRSYVNKNVTAGARHFRHTQMDGIKLKDQASDSGNLLKRCFCTLQLQKQHNQKMAGVKMHIPKNKPRYPQTFVVGRVAVEPYMDIKTKRNQSKNKDKARSTSTDAKLFHKTRGTKTDKKYLKNVEFPLSQCNPNSCPDYNKRLLKGNDMQTILPFTPSKFYKKQSKTLVCTNNKLDRNHATGVRGEVTNKPFDTSSMLTKGRRRLTAKKSNKSIPKNLEIKSNVKTSFFGRCVNFFCRRAESTFQDSENRPKSSKFRHQSEKIKLMIPPKRAKSIGENCPFLCPANTTETEKRFSKLHSGDAGNITKAQRKSTFNNNQSKGRYGGEKFVTFADTSDHLKNNLKKKKTVKYKSDTKSRLCYSCSANDCPLNNQKISGDFEKREKSLKGKKKIPSYSESADDCQYCACCKKKVDTDEISKGGGDRRSIISSRAKEDIGSCPCGKESAINGTKINDSLNEKNVTDKLSRKFTMTKDKCCNKIKPVLELKLDCVSHTIINKSEVEKKLEDLCISKKQVQSAKSKHQDFCTCCKCLSKRGQQEKLNKREKEENKTKEKLKQGAAITVSAKGAKVIKPPKKIPPCICGSKKCATESKVNKDGKSKKEMIKLTKTCVCGSRICASESRLMKRKKRKMIHSAKSKAQSLLEKMERKELLRRTKIEDNKEEIRRRKRIKRNLELENKVKKYKDASDLFLAIDSLTDIGRLGLTSVCGTARYAAKSMLDPKVACERLCRRCRKKDPNTLMRQLEQDYLESDTASTMRRLKTRCLYMKRVQSIKEKLENNPISHFILHFADKNPKTRIFKRKPARHIREPVDFQCSLYMATLRKRPYLSVYYKWPWFYPHFITILNIWRQFTDIMLFLLAAVVWSPCILCMEGCRALMCCFFCTG